MPANCPLGSLKVHKNKQGVVDFRGLSCVGAKCRRCEEEAVIVDFHNGRLLPEIGALGHKSNEDVCSRPLS